MASSYTKLFNNLMNDFFEELIEIVPEETKIKVHYNLFQTLCKAHAKKPCIDFMLGSVNYLEKISMKDEAFFTSDDKPAILSSINIDKWWGNLSENTKAAIWSYIKNFFAIGIHIVDMPLESRGMINFIINN